MIAVGVDTHKERHRAAALDELGQVLGEFACTATAAGYADLQRWAESHGDPDELVFGIEGAGSWGAGLCEHLQHAGHAVVEVERPRRASVARGSPTASTRSRPPSKCWANARRSRQAARGSARGLLGQPAPSTQRDRSRHAPRTDRQRNGTGNGTGKQLKRRLLSMRSRVAGDVEERAVFSVMRDLAARSRALTADAERYEHDSPSSSVRSTTPSSTSPESGPSQPPSSWPATRHASSTKRPLPAATGRRRSRPPRATPSDTASTEAATARSTTRSTPSPSSAPNTTPQLAPTSTAGILEGKTKREALRALKRNISRDLFKRLADVSLTS